MAKSTIALFAASLLIAMPAGAQTPPQHLEQTRQLLHDMPVPADADAAKRVAALQQDFNEFASDYLLQNSRPAAADAAESRAERPASWRSRYLLVEADLTALLGPANAPDRAGAAAATIDPQVRDRLQQIRTHLQTFYAATIQSREGNPVAHTGPAANEQAPVAPTTPAPQTPPARPRTESPDATAAQPSSPAPPAARPAQPAPTAGIDPSTALQLLDRIQSILDGAANGESPTSLTAIGTSGTKGGKSAAAGGKVTIDRGLLDEIRAELSQIRTLLQP
jgi:hypothetical protein